MNEQMNELYHHGVKGQKWGVRRYQNYDGTRTSLGKQHRERIYSRNADKANDIYKTLSKKEKFFVTAEEDASEYTNRNEYRGKNSMNVYSKISSINNTPVSVLDVWSIDGKNGEISIMTRGGSEFRGKGYASKAVKRAKKWFQHSDFENLYWNVNNQNDPSIQTAIANGFRFVEGDDYWSTYILSK